MAILADVPLIQKVIYGNDDRADIYQCVDNLLTSLSKSTAAQIPNELLKPVGNKMILSGPLLSETGVCKSERFANQLTSADCSGFLIGSDILVTAGHCVENLSVCKNNFWIFDYANQNQESTSFTFTKNQIFRCTQIIAHAFGSENKSDYSILRLDREVTGRIPLKYRMSGKIDNHASLAVIGHPSGLPTKITTSVDIRDNSNNYFFTTNSDTYTGSSGSAVVNTQTGEVEGILIRGDIDFIQAEGQSCRISKVNSNNCGRGEDVMRINAIAKLNLGK